MILAVKKYIIISPGHLYFCGFDKNGSCTSQSSFNFNRIFSGSDSLFELSIPLALKGAVVSFLMAVSFCAFRPATIISEPRTANTFFISIFLIDEWSNVERLIAAAYPTKVLLRAV